MTKFENGKLIYHVNLGAGTIVKTQELDIGGNNQLYYVVEMAIGSRLMIPVSHDRRMRSLRTSKAIKKVLLAAPEDMAVDYLQRRGDIERKVNSGDQLQSAEVFRDLAWRAHNAHLSNTDKQFMNNMKTRLVDILSLQTDLDTQEATQWLELTLEDITNSWPGAERET